MDRVPMMAVVPSAVAVLWYVAAPFLVVLGNPRIRQRNRDHYLRLVRFSRMWGLAAVMVVGVALVR